MKPSIKDRKKFDIDLKWGEVREKQVADMLQNKTIEVKSERDMWQRTGNIAVEYESYGKPSGIIGFIICALEKKPMQHLFFALMFYAVLLTPLIILRQ